MANATSPKSEPPSREEIISLVAEHMYRPRILNNSHRGDVVEMMVLAALGDDWRLVGLGWHPWDLQRGSGDARVRVQVKQSAALQLWGETVTPTLNFGWKPNPPSYFFRDNPDEIIEDEGWFCDLFVFGLHRGVELDAVDHVDPAQWEFLVVPVTALKPGTNSMTLRKALKQWKPVPWSRLREEVERLA